jgi:Glycosyltransferase family 87
MKHQQLIFQTVFAFVLFLIPTIALEPMDSSTYTVSDFFSYYSQVRMLVAKPGTDVYSIEPMMNTANALFPLPKGHLYLVGEPPVSLTFLLPLFLIPPQYSLWTFKTLLALFAALSVALLCQIFELKERQYQLTCVLVALSGPLWESTRVSKTGLIVLLGLSLSLWALKSKKTLAAAIFLLPWTFKPQLMAPFICSMLGAKQLKFIACLVGATAVLTLVTLPLFGITNYQAWLAILKFGVGHPELNSPSLHPTVRGQLMLLGNVPNSFVQAIALLSFAVAQIVGMLVGWRLSRRPDLLLWCTMCMPCGILCSPYCHNYDLVLLIPSVIAFYKLPGLNTLKNIPKIICMATVFLCLLVFEMPIYTRIHYDFLQHGLLTFSPFFCSLFVMSIIFLAMILRESSLPEPALAANSEA